MLFVCWSPNRSLKPQIFLLLRLVDLGIPPIVLDETRASSSWLARILWGPIELTLGPKFITTSVTFSKVQQVDSQHHTVNGESRKCATDCKQCHSPRKTPKLCQRRSEKLVGNSRTGAIFKACFCKLFFYIQFSSHLPG